LAYRNKYFGNNCNEECCTEAEALGALPAALGSGDGIKPYHWITRSLITAFENNPARFQWSTIDVKFPDLEREIVEQKIINDEVSSEQRAHAEEQKRDFEEIYSGIRAEFDKLFAVTPKANDLRASQILSRLCRCLGVGSGLIVQVSMNG
jgi:hypothetical protein